jgi:hypothetical protein
MSFFATGSRPLLRTISGGTSHEIHWWNPYPNIDIHAIPKDNIQRKKPYYGLRLNDAYLALPVQNIGPIGEGRKTSDTVQNASVKI